ncbi:1-aminocyclopropane-1-carboxylate deaminase/D-cysteine desulfhydrase [Algoriphagus pacificus]|uniref:1-aminocyclopropane-1-carboxylate deaminase/D-cysteine desulfhydrase n=1 Tax=Algoriphagus pacificus TaxID=2811234 RepID=A0ABS3CAH9_9BACT|nr:pyridoxal-phosphate dependent enzyme [Algoriphagus pacificus]MBN7814117.1 1-aminocyclopropane-1-carboxylate deaminase/D-cysteine desulfhydrase [Algoriphagus pacificus]
MLQANPIFNQPLNHDLFDKKQVHVEIKRLDLVHPEVSGNKFYKLKYNLEQAKNQNLDTVLTFGGAYSNHIAAVSSAAKALGLKSIGIIRGEKILPLNPTLLHAEANGMNLQFISREAYRSKNEKDFLESLKEEFGSFYVIPEGGTNELAIAGTQEILTENDSDFSYIVCPIGTGGTFCGLAKSINTAQALIGISALKGDWIFEEMEDLYKKYKIEPEGSFQIENEYHFGGYAKSTETLIDFIWGFYEDFQIILDPIYTGKMVYAIWEMIEKDQFPKGSKILLLHTGGLQGNQGFTERTGIKLPPLLT